MSPSKGRCSLVADRLCFPPTGPPSGFDAAREERHARSCSVAGTVIHSLLILLYVPLVRVVVTIVHTHTHTLSLDSKTPLFLTLNLPLSTLCGHHNQSLSVFCVLHSHTRAHALICSNTHTHTLRVRAALLM